MIDNPMSSAQIDQRCLVVIPSRMGSGRFPGKALIDIGGVPMIIRVWQQAVKADVGPVIIAAGDQVIIDVARAYGADARLVQGCFTVGTDRVFAAVQAMIKDGIKVPDTIINVQGDMPFIPPQAVRQLAALLGQSSADTVTLVCRLVEDLADNPAVVKVAIDWSGDSVGGASFGMARDFSRTMIRASDDNLYYHAGVYGYRFKGLACFARLAPSPRETKRSLEQMRLLDNAMTIAAGLLRLDQTGGSVHGVDRPQDLDIFVAPYLKSLTKQMQVG